MDPHITSALDLPQQSSSLLDLAINVTELLQKQADRLLHQRDAVAQQAFVSTDLDIGKLGKDVELASRCFTILEVRRELRTAVKDLELFQVQSNDGIMCDDWTEKMQQTTDKLTNCLKEGIL